MQRVQRVQPTSELAEVIVRPSPHRLLSTSPPRVPASKRQGPSCFWGPLEPAGGERMMGGLEGWKGWNGWPGSLDWEGMDPMVGMWWMA